MRRTTLPLCCLALSANAQWQQLPDFPGTACDDAAAFAIGSDVYIGTGREVTFGLTNDWYRYSTAEGTWHPVAPLPAEGRQYGTAFTLAGTGYFFGGSTDGGWLAELWAYDPATDAWAPRAPLPAPGRSGMASFVIDDTAYIVSGRHGPGSSVTTELWAYDPSEDAWSERMPMPGMPRLLAASFALDGAGFVVAGQDSLGVPLSDGWRYDAASNAWSAIAPLPGPARYGAEGFGIAPRCVVVCGAADPHTFSAEAWSYDPVANDWDSWPTFIGPARKGGAGAVVNATSFVYGTGVDDVQRYADMYAWDGAVGLTDGNALSKPSLMVNGDRVSFRIPEASIPASIDIRDVQGRVLRNATLRTTLHTEELSGLPPGIYLAVLHDTRVPVTLHFVLSP